MNAGYVARQMQALFSLVLQWVSLLRRFAFRIGLRRSQRAPVPVISIGNISFGGTGKTPVVIALAQALKARGLSVCILSRGYRRKKTQPTELVDPNGAATRFGDEPLLIAQKTGVPVVVDARRARAALWAMDRLKPQLFLLDDGFSHLQLERDFDLVLLAKDDLRPVTRRRELRRALRDADALATLEPAIDHAPKELYTLERRVSDPEALRGKRVVAMAAIAHPERFSELLVRAGATVTAERFFHDHHPFPDGALAGALATGDYVAITEKDAVKLATMPDRVIVVRTEVSLPETLVSAILKAAHIIDVK